MLFELAINLLSNALWELGLKPLYRASTSAVAAERSKRSLQRSIRNTGRVLAAARVDSSPTLWADFLRTDELRTLVMDLFLVHLTVATASDQNVRDALVTAWNNFALAHDVAPELMDIASVVSDLATNIEQLVADAIAANELSADPQTAKQRIAIVKDRHAAIRQLVAPGQAPADEYERFETQLLDEVAARYGQIEPPNLLGRERIAIERLFVTPHLSRARSAEEPSDAHVPFRSFVTTVDRSVVLGNPGAGKSTLVAKTCVDLAREYGKIRGNGQPVTPWCIELRRLATNSEIRSLALTDYFTYWATASYQLAVPDGAFDWLLCRGRLLVVFDGLDELVDTSKRKDVRDAVESFCRRYATTPVLITSRFVGYSQAPLDPAVFDVVRLEDFDTPRVKTYAKQWFDIRMNEEAATARNQHTVQFLNDSGPTGNLRNNPLMLALLASLYRGPGSIPRNLPDVYDNCASMLFSTWDKLRGIEVLLSFAEHVRPALRDLAWWVFTTPSLADGVTRPQAVTKTAEYLEKHRFGNPDKARASAEGFIDFCRGRAWVFTDQGSTAAGEDLFGFTHRTFLEFFSAEYLAFRKQSAEELVAELVPKIVEEQWDVVALIALQIKARSYPDGADDIVLALLKWLKPYRGDKLKAGVAFLLRLLRGVVPSPPRTRELAEQVMLYAARGLSGREHGGFNEDARRVFNAIAGVGHEIQAEFLVGVVAAQRKLIREKRASPAQLGAELVAYPDRIGDARRFWSVVSRETMKICEGDLGAATLRHPNVALALWQIGPGGISIKNLVDAHGLGVLFRQVERKLVMSDNAAIRQLITAVANTNNVAAKDAWSELAELGIELGKRPLPWAMNAARTEIALCVKELNGLARGSRRASTRGTNSGRAAIWLVAACTFEALAWLQHASSHDTENFELYVRNLSLSKDVFVVAVADSLIARMSGGVDATKVAARLSLSDEWTGRVADWIAGRAPAVTFA